MKMLIRNTIIIILVSFASYSMYSQVDFENYTPLQSIGDLPEDFTKRTSLKVDESIENQIAIDEKKDTKKTKEKFLLLSNYLIDDLLSSGNVLFGDPTTQYINSVADKVLFDNPELRKELRFYCVKSNITNAFTTNQGMIFVTLGLLSQLENEAQLAFILGHEINHYVKKHVINSAIENEVIFSKKNRTKNITNDQKIIRLSDYSKKLELECDSVGFYYLQNAGYDVEEALKSFNILQFSHLPFDEYDVTFSELETANFIIPQYYKMDNIVPINFNIDEDDEKSSHPNLIKRRNQISSLISENTIKNPGVKYLTSEAKFLHIREIARFESIRTDLNKLNYIKVYYNSSLLLQTYPNSIYLQNSVAKSLYGLAKFKIDEDLDLYLENGIFQFGLNKKDLSINDRYQGSISKVAYFYNSISKNGISAIAIKYIFELNKRHPSDHLKNILDNLIRDLIEDNGNEKFKFDWFFYPIEIKGKSTSKTTNNSTDTLNKYEKLNQLKEKQATEIDIKPKSNSIFYKFIFQKHNDREEIKLIFDNIVSEMEILTPIVEEEYYRNNIGASSLVFVDPAYHEINESKGMKMVESEDLKFEFYKQIELVCDAAELESTILSPKLCEKSDVAEMNNLSTCNRWIEEIQKINSINSTLNFIPAESEYMKEISSIYDTKYFVFTGVLDYKHKKNALLYLPLLIFPPMWLGYPIIMLYPSHETYFYTAIYNSQTGIMDANDIYFIRRKPMAGNIQSYMYDILTDVKMEKK